MPLRQVSRAATVTCRRRSCARRSRERSPRAPVFSDGSIVAKPPDLATQVTSSSRPARTTPSPRRTAARSFAPIVVAFAAIAVGFLASTLYGEVRASQIDREAALIATNSLPRVERLVAAEAALRHLEVATEEYANGTG